MIQHILHEVHAIPFLNMTMAPGVKVIHVGVQVTIRLVHHHLKARVFSGIRTSSYHELVIIASRDTLINHKGEAVERIIPVFDANDEPVTLQQLETNGRESPLQSGVDDASLLHARLVLAK